MDRVGNKKGFGGLIMLLGFVMLLQTFIPSRCLYREESGVHL